MTTHVYTRGWFDHGPVLATSRPATLAYLMFMRSPVLDRLAISEDGDVLVIESVGLEVAEAARGPWPWRVEHRPRMSSP